MHDPENSGEPAGRGSALSVRELIDSVPVSWFQHRVLLLCVLLGLADGFDALAIGYLLPSMAKEWGVSPGEFGPAITVGLVGMIIGTTMIAPLADRFGRRILLLAATLLYAVFTAAIMLVSSVTLLAVMRFFAGIGLGAVLPNLVAVAGEVMPGRAKGRAILVVLSSTTVGGFLAGLVAGWLVPAFGWQSVYLVGVVVPLVLVGIAWRTLPESMDFLAVRGKTGAARRTLGRIDPRFAEVDIDFAASAPAARTKRIPIGRLFAGGRRLNTALLWTSWFACFVILYFLYSWLPTLLTRVGVPQSIAIMTMSLALLASTVGGLVQGWIIDRRRDFVSLAVGLPISVVLILVVPSTFANSALLMVVICLIGFLAVGVSQALSALSSALYPVEVRATGVGWAFGAGRIGSLIAPLVGGVLITQGVAGELILRMIAVPAAIAAISLIVLVVRLGRTGGTPADAADRSDERSVLAGDADRVAEAPARPDR
ncbi:MFS transporter [Pseudonocardia ailaonensis]|uniref:MFS transporter n=1 Tax=Pseudonocardia ailaonensis TaxID=367279 RepID=UPI0031DD66FA